MTKQNETGHKLDLKASVSGTGAGQAPLCAGDAANWGWGTGPDGVEGVSANSQPPRGAVVGGGEGLG